MALGCADGRSGNLAARAQQAQVPQYMGFTGRSIKMLRLYWTKPAKYWCKPPRTRNGCPTPAPKPRTYPHRRQGI